MFALEHSALDSHVLVLNKHYAAVRVVSAKRAFTMLFKDLAEIVAVEDDQYISYDFDSWRAVSARSNMKVVIPCDLRYSTSR